MAQTVKLKRTSVAGRIPTTSNIEVGELAFNTNDKALFVRGDSNAIVAIHDESTLHIDTTNNRIGIGTTSPGQKLEVAGRIRATTDPTFEAFESSSKRGGIQWNTGSDYLNIFSVGGDISFDTNGGNVGIGTINPSVSLEVNGDIGIGRSAGAYTFRETVGGGIRAGVHSNSANELILKYGANTEGLRLNNSGNVGIGVTSPAVKLEIAHGDTMLRLSDSDGTNQYSEFGANGGNATFVSRNNTSHGSFSFYSNNGSTTTERFFVSAAGAVRFNNAYTFPASDGSANQVLQTDGSGNLSFATVQAGGGGTVSEAFKNIAVSGQSTVVADGATDTLTFAAGSGMTITTNASSDTVTFAASSSDFTDSDGDTKIQVEESTDEDRIRFDTAGTERMQINNAGKVGIGNTNPPQKLTVHGAVFITDDLDSPGSAGTYTYNGTAVDYSNNGTRYWSWGSGTARGKFDFIQLENDGTNQQTAMSIATSGNVGIGTSAPASTLHVVGANDVQGGITLGGPTENNSAQKVGRIKTAHYSTSEEPFTAILTNAQSTTNLINIGGASGAENAATHIKFFTAANNSTLSGTQRMVIDSSGRVGIGESSPVHIVEAKGTDAAFIAHYSAQSRGGVAALSGQRVAFLSTSTNDDLVFGRAANPVTSSGFVERMRIDNGTGNVGIGETAPSQKLQVNGNIRADGHYYVGGNIIINSNRNLTNIGTKLESSAALTIDTVGQLNLDSGNDEIHLRGSGTTFGKLFTSGGDFFINHPTSNEDIIFTGNDGGSTITALRLDMSDGGRAIFQSSVFLDSDTSQLQFGDDNDMQISHNGSNGTINVGTGNLNLDIAGDLTLDADGGDIFLKDGGTQFGRFAQFLGSLVITSGASDTAIIIGDNSGNMIVGGNVSLTDNKNLKLGAGNDLQLYHDGSNSFIKNITNDLYLDTASGSIHFTKNGTSEVMASFTTDGAVTLRHDNSIKFATTSTGVSVTGALTASGDATIYNKLTFTYNDHYLQTGTNSISFKNSVGTSYATLSNTTLSLANNLTVAGDILAKDGNSSTDPSITFTGHTDTGIGISVSGSNDQFNIITDGVRRAYFNNAGITSFANVYTGASAQFRNYSGIWQGTTGTSGNGFKFVNTADSVTAMDLSASGNVVFAGEVEGASLDINGVADISGNLTVGGNLVVNGTTTTLNTATLDVEDKNITLNKGSGDTSSSANGAGITIQDAVNASTDATILWNASDDEFDFSHPINVGGLDVTGNVTVGSGGGSSYNRISFLRAGGANVGAIGWHSDSKFYVAGHPSFGATAGNDVRVYGFRSDIHLGDNTNGDVLTVCGTAGASDGNVGIGTTTPKAKLQVEEYGIDTTTTSTSATTQTTIDTFTAATFRSCRYTIQVSNTTDTEFHTTELLLVHDGTTPSITEFGAIFTGAAAEATFDADISSGSVRLRATPASTDSMTFKVIRHAITT